MRNSQITTKFLSTISQSARTLILDRLARHYGIAKEEVYEELTTEGAEHLLDYCPQDIRGGTSALMQKYGFC